MMQSASLQLSVLSALFVLAMSIAGAAGAEGAPAHPHEAAGTTGEAAPTAAGSAAEPLSGTVVVVIKDYKFVPEEITVRVGTTVRWENHERRQYHNVYFESLGDEPRDYFFPEEYRERTFDKPGTYPYICEPHLKEHDMKGVVHVVE